MTHEIKTHQRINRHLCDAPLETRAGGSLVEMVAGSDMAVDGQGLTHGGFVFGLADHAAMIAVNHPNVVLGSADVKFLKPVQAIITKPLVLITLSILPVQTQRPSVEFCR